MARWKWIANNLYPAHSGAVAERLRSGKEPPQIPTKHEGARSAHCLLACTGTYVSVERRQESERRRESARERERERRREREKERNCSFVPTLLPPPDFGDCLDSGDAKRYDHRPRFGIFLAGFSECPPKINE